MGRLSWRPICDSFRNVNYLKVECFMRIRIFVAVLLLTAALWRALVDWQATIGNGYAYRFTSIGVMMQNAWPDEFESMKVFWRSSGVPYAWDPVGATVMAVPVAAVLALCGGLIWLSSRRSGRRA